MGKFRNIAKILYYLVTCPEDILKKIPGQTTLIKSGRGMIEFIDVEQVINPQLLFVGKCSSFGKGTDIWVHDYRHSYGEILPKEKQKKIVGQVVIGNNVCIGNNIKIDCYGKVEIEDNCLLASNIYITDSNHGKEVKYRSYVLTEREISPVRIGQGSWIGERVCILAGANIGKRCIIGTNAVVTGTIPDYSMAVGCPARVIKTYNKQTMQWEKV